MNASQIYQLEIDLLLEGIFRRYGYDFQHYAASSLERRVSGFLKKQHHASPGELLPVILQDSTVFWEFVSHLSVPFTELFRNPDSFRALREQVVPYLHTFPFLKVWIAGCATGEEAYSMAILFHEEGLLDRTNIYCTDVNPTVLATAQQGSFPLEKVQQALANYEQAGGKQSWFDYFIIKGSTGTVRPEIKKALTFSKHNLTGDEVFGEMHLVLCRNVLIYFNRELQDQVLTLLAKSVVRRGYLCLGQQESLRSTSVATRFDLCSPENSIFRLRA